MLEAWDYKSLLSSRHPRVFLMMLDVPKPLGYKKKKKNPVTRKNKEIIG